MLVIILCPYIDGLKWLLTTINNSPKLVLCSSLSKTKLSNGSGVATMLSHLKSTQLFNQKFSS